MKVIVQRNSGVHFTAFTQSGQKLELDGSEDAGGQNQGARPMELVLAGLAGCSAIDVISILNKMRQSVTDCRIEVDGIRIDTIPAVFSDIHLTFLISGKSLDPVKVERAVTLSVEKYCSVSKMLESTVKIFHEIRIIQD